jgi:hypothetical protein
MEGLEHRAVRVVVGVVKPVGAACRPIALGLITSFEMLWRAAPARFPATLAAFYVPAAIIQHAIGGECGHVKIRVVKIQREEIARLQVLNGGARI